MTVGTSLCLLIGVAMRAERRGIRKVFLVLAIGQVIESTGRLIWKLQRMGIHFPSIL